MPFASQAQAAYLFKNHPDIAKRWAAEFPRRIKDLPKHKKKNDNRKAKRRIPKNHGKSR